MDHIPTPRLNRDREIERNARLKDIESRARASRPVDTGRDILRGEGHGGIERDFFGKDGRC